MSARSMKRNRERVLRKDQRRRARRASIAAGAALGATVMFAPSAEAATFEVNTLTDAAADGCTTDPAGCTLRDAVEDADANGTDDTITFASGLSGAIVLTQGQLSVDENSYLTITDPGPSEVTISGGDTSRIFLQTNGYLRIDQLDLTDGGGVAVGGGIYSQNESYLAITDSSMTSNSAGNDGGAIAVYAGHLAVTDSLITGNSTNGGRGGGIFLNSDYDGKYGGQDGASAEFVNSEVSGNTANTSGGGLFGSKYSDVEITDSLFSNNTASLEDGGGIFFAGGTIDIEGSEISGNEADLVNGTGGGIHVKYSEFELTDSTVSGNEAGTGGGIFTDDNSGPFSTGDSSTLIRQSTIADNTAVYQGGGIQTDGLGSQASVFIGQSTISGNEAGESGGGFKIEGDIRGPLEVNNSTISGNTAFRGGGVAIDEGYYEPDQTYRSGNRETPEGSDGALIFSNDTIADNTATDDSLDSGGGVYLGDYYAYYDSEADENVFAASTVELSSTIVADNAGEDLGGSTRAISGGFLLEYSLIENPAGATATQDPAGQSIIGADPQLGNLADNGGPTLTHLPAGSSPAIDTGIDNETARDQRGERRSVDLEPENNPPDDPTDIGSVEIQTGAPPLEPETRPLTEEEIPSSCELTLASAGLALGGTEGGQTITGSDRDDVLRGFGGADTVIGKAGDDCLTGDDDIDTIRGKSGDDLGLGGDNIDYMKGNTGDDDFRGNGAADRIKLGNGNDTGAGGGGTDNVAAGNGDDKVKGNDGDDRLFGNDGDDQIKGGSGGDVIFGGGGVNDINCGTGDDKVIVNGNKDQIAANCETIKVRSGNKKS